MHVFPKNHIPEHMYFASITLLRTIYLLFPSNTIPLLLAGGCLRNSTCTHKKSSSSLRARVLIYHLQHAAIFNLNSHAVETEIEK